MAYTPTVYTNDASSPDIDATNLNKSEQGIKLAHDIAVPVDCSSRVAEYTGDGIPLIPDNVAGRTYYQDEWATTDGFSPTNGTISVSGGSLVLNKTSTTQFNVYSDRVVSFSGKHVYIKLTALANILNFVIYGIAGGSATEIISSGQLLSGHSVLLSAYNSGAFTSIRLAVITSTSTQTGELAKVDIVYIGTGAYDTPTLDRAGNGNSLALTAVTPVNGKYGKEMSFNGSTSYAQASSPVIGTTGSILCRFSPTDTAGPGLIFDTRNSSYRYGLALYIENNTLKFTFCGATKQDLTIKTEIGTGVKSIFIGFDATNIYTSLDGASVVTTPIFVTEFTNTNNLTFGKFTTESIILFAGNISHFRYDSRIWTADEARAWSLNPISIDSRV